MKKILTLSIVILISVSCFAQTSNAGVKKGTLVTVRNWKERIIILPAKYWDDKGDEIIGQIGAHEFENVKKYQLMDNIPRQMLARNEEGYGKFKNVWEKLATLKVYKIATYTHINIYGQNTGQYCILRVPYQENKDWDTTAKWDTVYLLIAKEEVID